MKFDGSFGSWLKQRRKSLDLTQMELAEQVACSVVSIRQIEGNVRRPSKQVAERLADVLAISFDERPAFLTFARRSQVCPPEPLLPNADAAPRHNLPSQPTPFIGRVDELAQISERLDSQACRLLTLVGPGGIGKTRLALQAAREKLGGFVDGIYFVSLASVTSPSLIASSIASALKISLLGTEEPGVQLVNYLRDKHMLLVLDNFEHLMAGTSLLTDILANSPGIKALVTSRERLNMQEEWILVVEGLRYPETWAPEPNESYHAVQLFVQRAQQIQPTFSFAEDAKSVIAICQAVEGMPLAIELAATWLRAMPCHQIAEQIASSLDFLVSPLRNVPERHQTIRAVFDQSWRLLSESERHILMTLSVFRGGFDLTASEQVADAQLAVLAGLIDKSLVRLSQSGRYDMHELVRQYVSEKLAESGTATEAKRRHFEFFLSLAEQASQHYYSPQTATWLDRLEIEHDNLRAALAWSLINEVSDQGLHLAATLAWFWTTRFYRHEGRAWLEKFLASGDASSVTRATAIHQLAWLVCMIGDNTRAKALAAHALSMARSLGDRSTIAWSLLIRGQVMKLSSDGGRYAAPLLEEALSLFRELDDQRGLDTARNFVGRAMLDAHNYQRAALVLEEGIVFDRQAGIQSSLAYHLSLLACVALYQNREASQVITLFEEGLLLAREVGDRFVIVESLLGLGHVARAQGNYEQAQRHYQDSLASMDRETGHKYTIAEGLWGLGIVARAQGDYEQSRRYFQECLILNQGLDKWDTACSLAGLGGLAVVQQLPEKAANLLGAAAVLFEGHRDLYPSDRIVFDTDVATVRAQLGEATFETAWVQAQAMTLEQAIAYALEMPGDPGTKGS